MRFAKPLIPAKLLRRYKRFLADVELASGEQITVHVANPGAMTGLAEPGTRVWLSMSDNPARKLAHSWELVEVDLGGGLELVGINTAYPNLIVAEAIAEARIPELVGYGRVRREVRYGCNSRVDFVLESPDRAPCYLEVKNVHLMRRPGLAEFPDSVTARGARHLTELETMVRSGNRAVMFFLVQIASATSFALARDIDPNYGTAFDQARRAGVEAIAYRCSIAHDAIAVTGPVPAIE